MFSAISRKIKNGTFVEPTVQEFVVVQSPKKPRTVVSKDAITEEFRRQFDEEFADFDFGEGFEDLSEKDQEQQEQEEENLERLEEAVDFQEYVSDVDKALAEDPTDCIWVRIFTHNILLFSNGNTL